MSEESYAAREVKRSIEAALDLAARAAGELDRHPERDRTSPGVRRAIELLEAAAAALETGDHARAIHDLEQAGEAAGGALEESAGLGLELVEQTAGAIRGAVHRIRNAASRHTTFGAIRTPHSERLPYGAQQRAPEDAWGDAAETDRGV